MAGLVDIKRSLRPTAERRSIAFAFSEQVLKKGAHWAAFNLFRSSVIALII
jgi:hypothetical protein|tara:strand:- start:3675 stop:3827 length:153 start_codon:yes stop_codon:yes gene_type:complete